MGEWKELVQDTQSRWNENAEFWDDYMGEESNRWHRELIRPYTEKLLSIEEGQTVFDIACGNGNFSRRLADLGANVTAIDYSSKMIEGAERRSQEYTDRIEYKVMDATNENELLDLGMNRFDSAVSNMALMDIADITPLVNTLHKLLKEKGSFVFSIPHPCFQTSGTRKVHETEDVKGTIISKSSVQISEYLTPRSYEAMGISGQPVPHFMFHRPISYYMKLFFQSDFVLDELEEPTFSEEKDDRFNWNEIPPAMILRFRKTN